MNRACRYEPDPNRTYHELAMHYGVGVLPTRPYKPREKAYASHCTPFAGARLIAFATKYGRFFLNLPGRSSGGGSYRH